MRLSLVSSLVVAAAACAAWAGPVSTAWPAAGSGANASPVVASASPLGGLWATSDGVSVEVRDVRQSVRLSRSVADFAPLVAGMDPATARVARLCCSDSGRLLFVLLTRPGSVQAGVARWEDVVRVDVETGAASLFVSRAVTPDRASAPPGPMSHVAGRLSIGAAGGVTQYVATRNALSGGTLGTIPTQGAVSVTALAYDRVGGFLFAVDQNGVLFRMSPTGAPSSPLGNVGTGVIAATFSEHFGGSANGGLYLGYTDGRVRFVSAASARGTPPVVVNEYTTGAGPQDVSAATDGTLLVGDSLGARRVADTTDARLSFDAWLTDEVAQQVMFAKGLISPQGEPAGWVIDGDVTPGNAPFHPATPDAAAWTVLLLTASDELFHDPEARPLVRTVLQRYAGQLSGPAPSRNPDGIFRHWIDPLTGGAKAGWDPEFATMSTMKIVAAAARAGNSFSGDSDIVNAARSICCSVHNWDAYVQANGRYMYLKGSPAGGPVASSASQPYHEGIIFVEEAAFYGTSPATASAYGGWLFRQSMVGASYLTNRRVASSASGVFPPAFTSVYPLLLVDDFRAGSEWRDQIANVSSFSAAWTDDNAPRWFTVFSAGTTKPEWGGYHADAINDSPGNVATFTALCGLAARADGLGAREATAAYQAYRTGARQTFRSGASMLFRRSNSDPAWGPTDAGMPDVGMGGLGLADVLRQGFVDRVLTTSLPVCGGCTADVGKAGGQTGADGVLDNNDFIAFINAFFGGDGLTADIGRAGGLPGGDGALDNNDFIAFIGAYFAGC